MPFALLVSRAVISCVLEQQVVFYISKRCNNKDVASFYPIGLDRRVAHTTTICLFVAAIGSISAHGALRGILSVLISHLCSKGCH